MPIDAYSPCPGGTGKKIKFCCPDFLPELQQIVRMLEGEQYVACLKHIEQLEEKRSDRACLLSIKSMVLRFGGQIDEAQATVDKFLSHHPNNPIALAESAMLTAATKGGTEAMPILQRAIAAGGAEVSSRVYDAMSVVSRALLAEGQPIAARALLVLQATIDRKDRRAIQTVIQLNRSQSLPLLVRDDRALDHCPDDAAWKPQFDEAIGLVDQARWAEAAEKLAALAEQVPDAPVIWHNLAVLRGWLADKPGCIGALRKYAALDVARDDAVEAEALALCLADDPLEDEREISSLAYDVDDVEQLQAALTLARRVVTANIDPRQLADEDGPPPRAVYLLLDRDSPDPEQELALETIPTVLAPARLFGRQTDRPARLEVMRVVGDDVAAVQEVLAPAIGQGLKADPVREVEGAVSASWNLLSPKSWLPENASREQFREFTDRKREQAVLTAWPDLKLGLLGGKSLREAAADGPSIRLSAIVMLMEIWSLQTGEGLNLNSCRSELGLPLPEAIDPEQVSVHTLPLVRLGRVDAAKLSDGDLLAAYRRATTFAVEDALLPMAREIVERPGLAGREERLLAYSVLARAERDSEKALDYVSQGRTAAEAAGQSSASWDLLELSFRFERGEPNEAMQMLQHIESQHINEPGVGEALTHMLVQYGLILPDGTPVGMAGGPAPEAPAAGPGAAEPGKLWTPEGQKPAGEQKLWMPGME